MGSGTTESDSKEPGASPENIPNLRNVPKDVPEKIEFRARSWTTRLGAGVVLSIYLLSIASLSILALLAYLTYLDTSESRNVAAIFERAMLTPVSKPLLENAEGVKRVADALTAMRDDPRARLADSVRSEALLLLRDLERRSIVSTSQSARLRSCVAPGLRRPLSNALDDCVLLLSTLHSLGKMRVTDIERLQLMKEFSIAAAEHHQELRAFWLQAAQLVLLNLLLPLLTALFGYIFGTQGVDKANS